MMESSRMRRPVALKTALAMAGATPTRTTNPIGSTFATVRLRTEVTRESGSRSAALAMGLKLDESAHQRWRALNAPHLVALVPAGARCERGRLVERPEARVACTIAADPRNAAHGSVLRAREAGAPGVDAGLLRRGPAEPKTVIVRENRFQRVEFVDQCVQPLRPLR